MKLDAFLVGHDARALGSMAARATGSKLQKDPPGQAQCFPRFGPATSTPTATRFMASVKASDSAIDAVCGVLPLHVQGIPSCPSILRQPHRMCHHVSMIMTGMGGLDEAPGLHRLHSENCCSAQALPR